MHDANKNMKKLIPIVMLLLAPVVLQAQSEKPISDAALSEMIGIVLRDEFKPADEPKTIYLSERFLKPAWLPKIRNITFVLITDKELKERGKAHFLKKAPYWEDGIVRVDFGFGDPECSASGGSWLFHVNGDKVERVTGRGGGWGSNCSGGSTDTSKPQ